LPPTLQNFSFDSVDSLQGRFIVGSICHKVDSSQVWFIARSIHCKVDSSLSRFIAGRFIVDRFNAGSICHRVDSSQVWFIGESIHRGSIHRRFDSSWIDSSQDKLNLPQGRFILDLFIAGRFIVDQFIPGSICHRVDSLQGWFIAGRLTGVDISQGRFIAGSIHRRFDSSQGRFFALSILRRVISTENLIKTWNYLAGHTKLSSFCRRR
jgi:hypothetical protein